MVLVSFRLVDFVSTHGCGVNSESGMSRKGSINRISIYLDWGEWNYSSHECNFKLVESGKGIAFEFHITEPNRILSETKSVHEGSCQ